MRSDFTIGTIIGTVFALPNVLALELTSKLFVPVGFIFSCLLAYALYAAYQSYRTALLPDPPSPECAELEQHMQKLNTKHMAREAIRNKLLNAGWKENHVDLVLHDVHRPHGNVEKLMFYIHDQLNRKKSPKEIEQTLLTNKWSKKLVETALSV